ncbi:MAG: NAD(P)-dependent oxidoreductase [Patescibacteria group bacterium]|mgnify:CR=1 FL=1
MNTLILEGKEYAPRAVKMYRTFGSVYFWDELKGAKKKAIEASTGIVVVGLKYHLDKKFLAQFPRLNIIATPTTGLNHIDDEAAKERNIKVISLRGHTSFLSKIPSTAEETFGLIFGVMRHFPWAFDDVKRGNWDRELWKGNQLIGKTIGIVGCGRLGKIVAKYAHAFDMEVIGYDPHVAEAELKKFGIRKVNLETLLKKSDIVSLHVLLTKETENMFTRKHFKMMKPSACFINTARAEIVERDALITALNKKWIRAAAVDVLRDERGDGSHLKKDPLWKYAKENTNLLIAPHIGGATYEAMEVTRDFIAEEVAKHLNA